MTESEFITVYEYTLTSIENALDTLDEEIDYQSQEGILTLEFANRSKIIISRQPSIRELWIAAKSGGYHCRYAPETACWQDQNSGEELFNLLSRLCTEQACTLLHIKPICR